VLLEHLGDEPFERLALDLGVRLPPAQELIESGL
jgi:hypothetical protein